MGVGCCYFCFTAVPQSRQNLSWGCCFVPHSRQKLVLAVLVLADFCFWGLVGLWVARLVASCHTPAMTMRKNPSPARMRGQFRSVLTVVGCVFVVEGDSVVTAVWLLSKLAVRSGELIE